MYGEQSQQLYSYELCSKKLNFTIFQKSMPELTRIKWSENALHYNGVRAFHPEKFFPNRRVALVGVFIKRLGEQADEMNTTEHKMMCWKQLSVDN